MISYEKQAIEFKDAPSSTHSRLACVIRVTKEMNEMIVELGDNVEDVPSEQIGTASNWWDL